MPGHSRTGPTRGTGPPPTESVINWDIEFKLFFRMNEALMISLKVRTCTKKGEEKRKRTERGDLELEGLRLSGAMPVISV